MYHTFQSGHSHVPKFLFHNTVCVFSNKIITLGILIAFTFSRSYSNSNSLILMAKANIIPPLQKEDIEAEFKRLVQPHTEKSAVKPGLELGIFWLAGLTESSRPQYSISSEGLVLLRCLLKLLPIKSHETASAWSHSCE